MKKMKKILSALLVAATVVAMPLCASAETGICVYTQNGRRITDGEDWWLHSKAGVEADQSIFDNILVCSIANDYSCYGSSTGVETLTVGVFPSPSFDGVYVFSEEYSVKALQFVVAKQIQYIKSIGGVITGYSIVDDADEGKALNVSWNVGGMHHFARFELCLASRGSVGYYDLMYNDSRAIDIKSMNNSFGVIYNSQ